MRIPLQKLSQFTSFFQTCFLKSQCSYAEIESMLKTAQLIQPQPNTQIFSQDDAINQYYFLMRGMVGLYKNGRDEKDGNELNEGRTVFAGKVIGQYFNSFHNFRQFNAEVKAEYCQIIKVNKQTFHTKCQQLVSEYNQVQQYAKTTLLLNKKLNSFQLFTVKKYRLGSYVCLQGQIGVILKGQCKILYLKEKSKKSLHPSIDDQSERSALPSIIVKKPVAVKKKELVLVAENQWIFTQNLEENKTVKLWYVVSSQQLILLTLPVTEAHLLQSNRLSLLNRVSIDRKERATCCQVNSQSIEKSAEKQRQTSSSPGGQPKSKFLQAHRILQKLDFNLNPSNFLQKYKLGYNPVRYQKYDRRERSLIEFPQKKLEKDKSVSKLKPEYYKSKDWSRYVKMSNLRH